METLDEVSDTEENNMDVGVEEPSSSVLMNLANRTNFDHHSATSSRSGSRSKHETPLARMQRLKKRKKNAKLLKPVEKDGRAPQKENSMLGSSGEFNRKRAISCSVNGQGIPTSSYELSSLFDSGHLPDGRSSPLFNSLLLRSSDDFSSLLKRPRFMLSSPNACSTPFPTAMRRHFNDSSFDSWTARGFCYPPFSFSLFALPETVVRKVVAKLSIHDRLTLRLVCRQFYQGELFLWDSVVGLNLQKQLHKCFSHKFYTFTDLCEKISVLCHQFDEAVIQTFIINMLGERNTFVVPFLDSVILRALNRPFEDVTHLYLTGCRIDSEAIASINEAFPNVRKLVVSSYSLPLYQTFSEQHPICFFGDMICASNELTTKDQIILSAFALFPNIAFLVIVLD